MLATGLPTYIKRSSGKGIKTKTLPVSVFHTICGKYRRKPHTFSTLTKKRWEETESKIRREVFSWISTGVFYIPTPEFRVRIKKSYSMENFSANVEISHRWYDPCITTVNKVWKCSAKSLIFT